MPLRDDFVRIRNEMSQGNWRELTNYSIEKPSHFNWVEEIFYGLNVRENPDGQALLWKYGAEEKQYTFRELYDTANRLINLLRKHGATEGDRIYSLLPLVPANWVSFLATIKGGFILMPTAINLTQRDLLQRFQSLFPEIVIADAANADKIDEAENAFGQSIKIKVLVGGALNRPGWISMESVFEESGEAEAAETKSDDPVLYFFTSGTTGLPKIVVHTHFSYGIGHLTTSSWLGCDRGDVHYNISSPGWAKFAWSSFFAPWNTGATIFVNHVDSFVPEEQLETMSKNNVSTFCGSPTVYRMLIQEDLTKYNLVLKQCCAAGEPLNPEVIDQWQKGTGITIRDGYGQTETTALVANLPGEKIKPGSMGKPTFLYNIGIYDEEGQELPNLEVGIIGVKVNGTTANGVFVDYFEDEERRKQVFRGDIYLTGDKAYRDEDGYFWFFGRNDDVIKASAYRIGPFEVENTLIEHPAVIESAVVSSPHKLRGNAIKAFIVVKESIQPNETLAQEIFDFSAAQMAAYKVPRIIEFRTELPKTISGKIRRVELRAQEAQQRLSETKVPGEFFHDKY